MRRDRICILLVCIGILTFSITLKVEQVKAICYEVKSCAIDIICDSNGTCTNPSSLQALSQCVVGEFGWQGGTGSCGKLWPKIFNCTFPTVGCGGTRADICP